MEKKKKYCKHCGDDLSKVKTDPRSAQCARCRNYKHRYGIHGGHVNEMLEDQNGKCYLCDKEITKDTSDRKNGLNVDHCHETGEVRKLLCLKCNTLIGILESNNIDLERVNMYLQ